MSLVAVAFFLPGQAKDLTAHRYIESGLSCRFNLYIGVCCDFLGDEMYNMYGEGKGKSVPLQAWSGLEGSRKLRFPDFMTTAQEGGKVVSHTQRTHLNPRKSSWNSFPLEAESTPGP